MVTNTQTHGHLGHPRASLLLTSEKTVFCNYIRDVYFSRPERCFTYADIFVTDPLIKTHYVQNRPLSPSQSCQSSRNLKPLLADRTARTQASSQFYQLDSFSSNNLHIVLHQLIACILMHHQIRSDMVKLVWLAVTGNFSEQEIPFL